MKFSRDAFFLSAILFSLAAQGQINLSQFDPDILFSEGMELYQKKKYGSAVASLDHFQSVGLSGDPKKANAALIQAVSQLRLGNLSAPEVARDFCENHVSHPGWHLVMAELGSFYYARKDYKNAANCFSSADLFLFDKDLRSEYRFKLGYSYFAQKEFERASPVFQLVKSQEGVYRSSGYYYSAYINYKLDRYQDALSDLKSIEDDQAYKTLVPAMIVTIYYKLKDYDKVIQYAEKQMLSGKQSKNQEDVSLLIGEAYFQKQDFGKALDYFESAGSRQIASRTDINYRMGYASYQLGNYQKSVEYLKRITNEQDSLTQFAAYYLGNSYIKLGDKAFALGAYEFAHKLDYSQTVKENAWYLSAKILFDLGRYTSAITSLNQFEKRFPNSSYNEEIEEMLSESYLNTSNYDLAISYIESIKAPSLRIKRTYQKVAHQKALSLYNDGKFIDAIVFFEKALSSVPDLDLKLATEFWYAESLSASRQYKQAANRYQKVIYAPGGTKSEYFLKAKYGLGYALYNQKEYQDAIVPFKSMLDLKDGRVSPGLVHDATVRLADSYYATKEYKAAFAQYEKATNSGFSDQDYVHFQKAIMMYMLGNNEEAKRLFDVVINNFKTSRYVDEALYQKGQVELEDGNFQQASALFTALIKRQPESVLIPHAYLKRAVCYYNLKSYDLASNDYKFLLDKYLEHPVSGSALLGLQESLNQAGKSDGFSMYFEKYKRAKPTDQSLEGVEFQTAKNLYFSEKYDRSIVAFREYIKNHPGSANFLEANFYLAESYTRDGKSADAIVTYQVIINKGKNIYYNRAINRTADLAMQSADFSTAIKYYGLLYIQPETKREQNNATFGLADAYFRLNKWDSSEYYSGILLAEGSLSPLLQSKGMMVQAKSKLALEKRTDAFDQFTQLANQTKDEFGAESQYMMALILYQDRKYDQSMETLYDLSKNFGQYEFWLGKAFLLIADNLLGKNEILQAKATLSSIVERSPIQEIKDEAARRLEGITEISTEEGGDNEDE